ncbi:hypothetical protein PENSPDRAFT_504427 [Peniophora sp. CONT]|nr:hypothetical protein PENSPDRAFT_504427 [Peniophora sp. CONT]
MPIANTLKQYSIMHDISLHRGSKHRIELEVKSGRRRWASAGEERRDKLSATFEHAPTWVTRDDHSV